MASVGRAETPVAFHGRILTGHFREGEAYKNFRSRGSGDWLLILTADGSGRLGLAEGGEHVTKPGEVTLYVPGACQEYGTYCGREAPVWELQWVHFHPRPHWMEWLAWPELSTGLRRVELRQSEFDEVRELMSRMHRYDSSGDVVGKDLALSVLEQVILLCARSNPRRAMDERVERAMRWLAGHVREPLEIEALAARVRLSPSRLAHLFREQTGVTPLQFLERQRIDAAIRLLTATRKSVKVISAECGFASPFYFSLRFKKATGKSPSAYRGREAGEG